MKLALKITPQRSTQYANMTAALALPELLASPLQTIISEAEPVKLAQQDYLLMTIDDRWQSEPIWIHLLARLGAVSEIYEYFDHIDTVSGPLLRPIEPELSPFVPSEMAEARRYKGKTNEIFTRVLLNVALFAGQYARNIDERLRILDPLAGGGTTLFLALSQGYDAFGIDLSRQDIDTTAVFLRQYLDGEHIRFKERDERSRKAGRRYQFEVGPKGGAHQFVLVQGDTRDAEMHLRDIPGGPHMHAIVGDLPYGIQHFGEIADLLTRALPVWERMLLPGGTLALSWNATHVERAALIELVERNSGLQVRNEPPYTEFAHAVDRVIKRRDILVAVAPIST